MWYDNEWGYSQRVVDLFEAWMWYLSATDQLLVMLDRHSPGS